MMPGKVKRNGGDSTQQAEEAALTRLKAAFGLAVSSTHTYRGEATAEIRRDRIVKVCRFLRDDADLAFNFLMDLTVVDRLGLAGGRFEVVYHLYSLRQGSRLRLKARVPDSDPAIDSVSEVWRAANWMEREAYDMYGITFRNHPEFRRILLYPEFEGFPLRKDYPKERVQPLVTREDLEEGLKGGRKRA